MSKVLAIANQKGSSSLLLDMTTPPTEGNNYKFMRMNTNPCYLGFCNLLAMTCEKKCPTYMANPYFMTELTSDVQGLIYDLELFVPFKDKYNNSNFLFLPIVMTGNLFSWGNHPSNLEGKRVPEETAEHHVGHHHHHAGPPDGDTDEQQHPEFRLDQCLVQQQPQQEHEPEHQCQRRLQG